MSQPGVAEGVQIVVGEMLDMIRIIIYKLRRNQDKEVVN